jgi:Fe2+ or Zn2+ uptake regulation protein
MSEKQNPYMNTEDIQSRWRMSKSTACRRLRAFQDQGLITPLRISQRKVLYPTEQIMQIEAQILEVK